MSNLVWQSQKIVTGAGLIGGGDLSQSRTISIAPTSVVPSTYGDQNNSVTLSVNALGQITYASATPIPPLQSQSGVQNNIQIIPGQGITGGGHLTSDISLSINSSGVSPGVYGSATTLPIISVGSDGLIYSITTKTIVPVPQANFVTQVKTTAPLTGGGDLTTDRTISLGVSGTLTGTFGDGSNTPIITVDNHGLISNISTVSSVPAHLVQPNFGIITNSPLSGGGDLTTDRTISLNASGTPTGTFGDGSNTPIITVDNHGLISNISTVSSVPAPLVQPTLNVIAGTDLTGGGNLNSDISLNMNTTGVSVGTYGSANNTPIISLNAEGLFTNISTVTSVPLVALNIYNINAGDGLNGGGPISSDVTLNMNTTGVSAGTYGDGNNMPIITTNTQGLVTQITTIPITANLPEISDEIFASFLFD